MKNTLRTPDYINIKHKIASCFKMRHIESMLQLVERYAKQNKDGHLLQNLLIKKEYELQNSQ